MSCLSTLPLPSIHLIEQRSERCWSVRAIIRLAFYEQPLHGFLHGEETNPLKIRTDISKHSSTCSTPCSILPQLFNPSINWDMGTSSQPDAQHRKSQMHCDVVVLFVNSYEEMLELPMYWWSSKSGSFISDKPLV